MIEGTVTATGTFAPTNEDDKYAITDQKYGKDGLRNCDSIAERNNISKLRRIAGMAAGVTLGTPGVTTYYKLLPAPWAMDDSDWEELVFGGGSGGTLWEVGTGVESLVSKNTSDPNTATGDNSIAMGKGNEATNRYAHVEGSDNHATGDSSHAEGTRCHAIGNAAHAEGRSCKANSAASHAEGNGSEASLITEDPNRVTSHAEGYYCKAYGEFSSHAEGRFSESSGGNGSHAEGYKGEAIGRSSHAEGSDCSAIGDYSHAGGYYAVCYAATGFVHSYNSTLAAGAWGTCSAIIGGRDITGTQENMVYVPALMLATGTAPPNPEEGTIYFDSASKHFLGYDGTTWKQLDN